MTENKPNPALNDPQILALVQAANRLIGYCHSVNLRPAPGRSPAEEPACLQMEGWCHGLLEDADRLAKAIDAVLGQGQPGGSDGTQN